MGNISGTPPSSGSGSAQGSQWDPTQDLTDLEQLLAQLDRDIGNPAAMKADMAKMQTLMGDLKSHAHEMSPKQQAALQKMEGDFSDLQSAVQNNDWSEIKTYGGAVGLDTVQFPRY